ncbi:hypothetical protein, partial [Azospirillum isscasi]
TWGAVAASAGLRRTAFRATSRALELAAAGFHPVRAGQGMYVSHYYGQHWVTPLRDIRPAMLEAHRLALAHGESDDAGYALVTWLRIGWHLGTGLSQLEAETQDVLRRLTRIGFRFYTPLVAGLAQAIAHLRQETPTPWRLTGHHLDEDRTLAELKAAGNSFAVSGLLLIKMQIARLFGAAGEARAIARDFAPYARAQRGTYLEAIGRFELGLIGTMGPFAGPAERRRAARGLTRSLRWLRRSA